VDSKTENIQHVLNMQKIFLLNYLWHFCLSLRGRLKVNYKKMTVFLPIGKSLMYSQYNKTQ